MKHGSWVRLGMMLVAGALLIGGSGCNELLARTNIGSFLTGLAFGNFISAGSVETLCYQNGVLIDCAALPENLQPK